MWTSSLLLNCSANCIIFYYIYRMLEFLPLPTPKIDWPLPNVANVLATFLFILECYHFIWHVCVLFRVRLLPRKDLVRIRYYFLLDTLTVFTVCFLYTGKLRWLAAVQMVQHLFFFFTWNKQSFTNKVCFMNLVTHQLGPVPCLSLEMSQIFYSEVCMLCTTAGTVNPV